ncbi:NEW3 domain-containing protein [bacterium]|nr:NEW3 domain-containing protein [bacterium]
MRIRYIGTIVLLFFFTILNSTYASQKDSASHVSELNEGLLQLLERAESGGPSADQAAEIIKKRNAHLYDLIQKNPSKAVGLAFSSDILKRLASAFPDSASYLEEQGTWKGDNTCFMIDDPTMTRRQWVHRLKVGDQDLDVNFDGLEPGGLRSGVILKVKGVKVGKRVAGKGEILGESVAAATTCSTSGNQNTVVLLVTFPGISPPSGVTTQTVYDAFFGATGRTVDKYWREASYNQASASGAVYGWYTLNQLYTCDQYDAIRSAAIAAADPDVNFTQYTRLFIIMPNPGSCGWAGLGSLGCWSNSSQDGNFSASVSWELANYFTNRDNAVKLSCHEGGHNLSLHHASTRDFGTETLGPLGTQGTLNEYGDVFNTMGSWNLGHYGAPHKVRLGWLASGSGYQTVTNDGTFTILPIESSSAGLKGLKIQRGTGNNAYLWVEYRQSIGDYDTTLNSNVFQGALIHYEDSFTSSYTHLLDFTPDNVWTDTVLRPGLPWTDAYSNVTLNVQSATSSGLTLNVDFGPVPCVQANPTVTVSPSNPSVYPGNSVNYTVNVKNNDSSGCSSGTFNLSSTLPSGWGSSFSNSSITLSPGANGNVTMTKTAPGGTAVGTYGVNATATSGSYTGTGTANCTVTNPPPPLNVSVSSPAGPFSVRQTVAITATVLSGSNPASGASVTFTMTKANGKTTTKTLTTNSSGKAVWNYKIAQKDPKGQYSVSVTATFNGQNGSSTTPATFTVQ